MTLKELFVAANGAKEEVVPYRRQLLSRREKVLAEEASSMGNGSVRVRIRVFESGYVLYEEDEFYTVFHLQDIRGKAKVYNSASEEMVLDSMTIPEEVFMDADWTLKLTMEGNERLWHNRQKCEQDKIEFSYSGVSEDIEALAYVPDFLRSLNDEIDEERMRKVLEIVSSKMNPITWKVYVMTERDGMMQPEIAEELGITQQAVSKIYRKACEIIARMREQLKNKYEEN